MYIIIYILCNISLFMVSICLHVCFFLTALQEKNGCVSSRQERLPLSPLELAFQVTFGMVVIEGWM